uniref:Uncharacterized protein n=1 Tax=Knipowitschia caucasica TaxID=637954 RepID=A0AAV2LQA2_KNICA
MLPHSTVGSPEDFRSHAEARGNTEVQGGINTTILFEGPSGEQQLSHLELVNEGKTTIFYSWQQIPLPHHFPHLLPRTKKFNFSFNSSSVCDIVKGIHTPHRPSSPAELYQTEEEEFLYKNPKIFYKNQPIEDLKSLWYKVQPENEWDLSISTLRQALRSLPVTEVEDGLNQDTGLAQLNSVLLQLYEASPQMQRAKAATIGQLLWRELLDTMTSEAVRLSHLLQLPEKETWLDQEENKKEDIVLNTELTPSINEEKMDKKAGPLLREKRSLTKSKKDMRHNEDRKKGKVSGTDLGKDRRGKEADVEDQASEDPASDMNLADVYTRLLQQKFTHRPSFTHRAVAAVCGCALLLLGLIGLWRKHRSWGYNLHRTVPVCSAGDSGSCGPHLPLPSPRAT